MALEKVTLKNVKVTINFNIDLVVFLLNHVIAFFLSSSVQIISLTSQGVLNFVNCALDSLSKMKDVLLCFFYFCVGFYGIDTAYKIKFYSI